ncbi:hypothetical protein COLO4_23447 [Corchorus olitorius]|uniref:Uncharacterized protein n=1 Tax=Corchorus olitorius TaxID=93759 RepID=A0A1R3IGM4_9ROSI|nr:hypothetical protein COLO4_23447 [Corchorus olitorius]
MNVQGLLETSPQRPEFRSDLSSLELRLQHPQPELNRMNIALLQSENPIIRLVLLKVDPNLVQCVYRVPEFFDRLGGERL